MCAVRRSLATRIKRFAPVPWLSGYGVAGSEAVTGERLSQAPAGAMFCRFPPT